MRDDVDSVKLSCIPTTWSVTRGNDGYLVVIALKVTYCILYL
jgi:hypothetical protein